MKIPNGYTEKQVIEIIERIAKPLAKKFKFGYHEIDDITQQIFVEILKPDKNGITILEKFDPDKGNSLDSFLWIHARNRLHNFKRDNFARPDLPCNTCPLNAYVDQKCTAYLEQMHCEYFFKWFNRNETKKSLATSKSTEQNNEESYEDSINEKIFTKDIYSLVEKNIPVSLREDWIRFTNKLKLSKQKREYLTEFVMNILKENGIEPETW